MELIDVLSEDGNNFGHKTLNFSDVEKESSRGQPDVNLRQLRLSITAENKSLFSEKVIKEKKAYNHTDFHNNTPEANKKENPKANDSIKILTHIKARTNGFKLPLNE